MLRAQGGQSPAPLWALGGAVADPACLDAELLRHRENPNLF